MTSITLILFPDTNFFLECRTPNECPWGEITDASEIVLAVCRQVRSEIDHQKSTGRGNKSIRARDWSNRLRQAGRAGGQLELRSTDPRVLLLTPPPVPPLAPLPALLDPARPDDRVIADIMAQRQANAEMVEAQFLTDDGGAADTARHVGLPTIEVPLDEDGAKRSWRLPREPDGMEKKVKELERRLAHVEQQAPIITIKAENVGGDAVEELTLPLVHFAPLQPHEAEQLVEYAISSNPRQTEFQKEPPARPTDSPRSPLAMAAFAAFGNRWQPPDPGAIQQYQDKLYPEWIDKLRQFFLKLHSKLGLPNRIVAVKLHLANAGTIPAEHAILTLEALGGVRLMRLPESDDDSPIDLTMPAAPVAPQGRFFSLLDPLNVGDPLFHIPSLYDSRPRLPPRGRFHWRDRDNRTCWLADCEEFRHQEAPQTISFLIGVSGDAPRSIGAVRCTLSARNLPQPVQVTLPVSTTIAEGDTGAYAMHIFHLKKPWRLPIGRSVLAQRPDVHT